MEIQNQSSVGSQFMACDFDVYEDTFAVTVGLEKQAKSGIAEALAPQIKS